ncbi:hypothetical protein BGZ61DRAFT_346925 [Ilyonectria robusta]|uniref:uncharacterized protein n=1 Tax=Ilyonectria robusta TaxID=1079257 RepID=UPI001E8DC16C|nr:uncharacterized protein BGZ61DRAFT_346925 [Ilyonectria robusta]KAH8721684.1 hypothetical protein BGZ61DRAFT_346925 [Ilyonectria robusta]
MKATIILIAVALSASGVTADWWADFSNNLFTDLTPLISLFGEQPTKQLLGESLTYFDYFIFAMAPLGILTAVVSAIRVRGGPSLRAFIGRAQEGAGGIEAELCSSTSRDICELYDSGGIPRVFGTARLLELVHDPAAPTDDFMDHEDRDATAGLYTFADYFNKKRGHQEWKEVEPSFEKAVRRLNTAFGRCNRPETKKPSVFAPAPNLTLTLWMRRPSNLAIWMAALTGFVMQAGVVVVAAVVTYRLQLKVDDKPPNDYGFLTMCTGTALLCTGNFLCAFLIGEITKERLFERKLPAEYDDPGPDGHAPSTTRLIWLQGGNQVIGDQTFDCFAYNDAQNPAQHYITSWKDSSQRDGGVVVWLAIILSTIGFVAQFVGLRKLHPLVSVAQLGAMLVMSAIRSLLRTQRLLRKFNLLNGVSDVLQGHELDWLALHLEIDETSKCLDSKHFWTKNRLLMGSFIRDTTARDELTTKKSTFWVAGRAIERGRIIFMEGNEKIPVGDPVRILGARQMYQRREVDSFFNKCPLVMSSSTTLASKILAYRTRLARLTNPSRVLHTLI